jgi:hypothetical protein
VKRLIALGAVALALVAGYLWLRSDQRRIFKALERLESACEKEGPDSPMSLLTRNQAIVGAFAPGFLAVAEPDQGSFTDAQELARAIHVYRASSKRIEVDDSERRLEIGRDGTAEMETLFRVAGESGSGPGVERFRARLFWVEHEGEWKIREFRVVEVVERGGLFF